jgi:hypothetical protein
MDDQSPSSDRLHTHHHAVQFYGNDASLYKTVAGFLSEGLVASEPALIIATRPHTAGILSALADRLIDVERARYRGDLLILDAQQTLALFMTGDVPEPAAFDNHVGGIIEGLLRGRSSRTIVRAYGEMVDVLWKEGREDAAIRLEILWNKLAGRYGFALLCGYSMGNFYKQAQKFEEVCEQHTHVMDPDTVVVPFPPKRIPA